VLAGPTNLSQDSQVDFFDLRHRIGPVSRILRATVVKSVRLPHKDDHPLAENPSMRPCGIRNRGRNSRVTEKELPV
jgi:hypothetical protein